MNVEEIIAAHLRANGHDGLCTDDCGCALDDFMPCVGGGGEPSECVPARKVECTEIYCKTEGYKHLHCGGWYGCQHRYLYRPAEGE